MGITVFLCLDDALILGNSYTQVKEDGQRVVQLLQRLGFVLSLEKCQLEPTQEFTHLGLLFSTQNMTLSLPQNKVLAVNAQAAKVMSFSTCRGVMRLLGLRNLPVSLPLYYTPTSYFPGSRRITRLELTCQRGWNQVQGQLKPCIGGTPLRHGQN